MRKRNFTKDIFCVKFEATERGKCVRDTHLKCDQIGRFLKVVGNKFSLKNSPNNY